MSNFVVADTANDSGSSTTIACANIVRLAVVGSLPSGSVMGVAAAGTVTSIELLMKHPGEPSRPRSSGSGTPFQI